MIQTQNELYSKLTIERALKINANNLLTECKTIFIELMERYKYGTEFQKLNILVERIDEQFTGDIDLFKTDKELLIKRIKALALKHYVEDLTDDDIYGIMKNVSKINPDSLSDRMLSREIIEYIQ